ncbi:MAG: hypothetical protein OXG53_05475 [Chloroflexi bacterium]|nr:hypothetical protein [Chloroflexota bacterium]
MNDEIAVVSWEIIGHDWAADMLRRSLLNRRQRHAYLITGAPSLGKRALALAFAKALNCEDDKIAGRPCGACRSCRAISRGHDPDLIIAKGENGAPLKIEAIRDVARLLALKPYSARYRIAIFEDFDLVAPQAQDALLKTLEEPAAQAIMILLASSPERVLPTIRSRAQAIPLRPAPLQLIKAALVARGCDEDRADLVARLSSGRIGWALHAIEDDQLLAFRREMLDELREIVAGKRLVRIKAAERLSQQVGKDKAALRDILEIWLTFWRDVLLQSHDCPVKPCNSDRADEIRSLAARSSAREAQGALVATRRTIEALATNANLRLALDALLLEYPGLE